MGSFPRGTFLGIGITIIVLAIVQIGCGIGFLARLCSGRGELCSDGASVYGLLFFAPAVTNIITGGLGIGAANSHVGHRKFGLKIGFMVMCILSAFGTIGMCYYLFNFIHNINPSRGYNAGRISYDAQGFLAALWISGIANVILFIKFVVGASFSCCCSPVSDGYQV